MPSAPTPPGMRPWEGRYARRLVAITLHTYGTVCHLCRQDGARTADHLIPRSKGGSDDPANLRPAHQGCNSLRNNMDLAEWFARHPVPRRQALAPSREW